MVLWTLLWVKLDFYSHLTNLTVFWSVSNSLLKSLFGQVIEKKTWQILCQKQFQYSSVDCSFYILFITMVGWVIHVQNGDIWYPYVRISAFIPSLLYRYRDWAHLYIFLLYLYIFYDWFYTYIRIHFKFFIYFPVFPGRGRDVVATTYYWLPTDYIFIYLYL